MYVTFIVQPLEYATLIMNFPFYRNDLLNTADSAGPIRLPNKMYVTFMINPLRCATLMHLACYREPIVARSSEADVSYVTFIMCPLEYATLIMHLPYYRSDLSNIADFVDTIASLPNLYVTFT